MHLSGRSEKPVISHERAFLSPILPASDSRCLVAISRQIPWTEPPPEASSSVARKYFLPEAREGRSRPAQRPAGEALTAFPLSALLRVRWTEKRGYSEMPCFIQGRSVMKCARRYAMPQKTALPMSRIDARIPLSVRETIDRVAAMQGRTCTDFLIAAVLEKAEQVIAEQSLVRLALEDQRLLATALLSEETETPSAFLENLSSEYAQRVERR